MVWCSAALGAGNQLGYDRVGTGKLFETGTGSVIPCSLFVPARAALLWDSVGDRGGGRDAPSDRHELRLCRRRRLVFEARYASRVAFVCMLVVWLVLSFYLFYFSLVR